MGNASRWFKHITRMADANNVRKRKSDSSEVKKPQPKQGQTSGGKSKTRFTPEQLLTLNKIFEERKYIDEKERQELAENFNVAEKSIHNWFQNARTRWKKAVFVEQS
ncbi:unnamed protein product [Darwinula stevensoni]|uniref:Homeobox domain-containing protein n=1 Tax=Darwinula stevensoni TaxID=69355 RepID=A0A7R8X8X2_9CRUS|nr:unnamed protein product [Darwinula stevensoni]CAG0889107.1 unnamed protein product [Darwinula stevensoni]